jgi:hypothetical protein
VSTSAARVALALVLICELEEQEASDLLLTDLTRTVWPSARAQRQ